MSVYKILTVDEWNYLSGSITQSLLTNHPFIWDGNSVDLSDKFIHLSTKSQAVTVANLFYSSNSTLCVLEFSALEGMVWDSGFPHLYKSIEFAAIPQILNWIKDGSTFKEFANLGTLTN